MTIYIFCKSNSRDKTISKLKKTKIFSKIIKVEDANMLALKTKDPYDECKRILEIQKKLRKISTIRSFKFYPLGIKKGKTQTADITPRRRKILHIFFDIDSTLTHQGITTLNRNVKEMFGKFIEQNCYVYFCTGRSSQDVKKLIKIYKTSPYGIAENGGIIINSSLPYEKFGDRTEPDKLIQYLTIQNIPYELDVNQQSRKTECIIMKEKIERSKLIRAAKKSKADVEIHASKNTYHISKKGVNKGSAIEYMISNEELDLGCDRHEIIAVGDSDLDIPMFEHVDYSYAVKDAADTVKKKAKYTLKNKAPKAIEEVYCKLFTYA